MQLEKLEYCQHKGESSEWKLEDATFGNINLIVGKNATGKSKILNVIRELANALSRYRVLKFEIGSYKAHFRKNGEKITYLLEYKDKKVINEKLLVSNKVQMTRKSDGTGTIKATQYKDKMKFQIPNNEIAALVKKDSIQHPFLDDLYNWAENLIHFPFSSPLGRDKMIALISGKKENQIDQKDTEAVVLKLRDGEKRFGKKFISQIKKDILSIGYEIDSIELGTPTGLSMQPDITTSVQCMIVKESDLKGQTEQQLMSQGMFRAFSLIVQINYLCMSNISSCILIDDIGEGLDYERSTSLIKLIIKKAENKNIQLLMATNDRFVMNNVSLRYWSVINRLGNKSVLYNRENYKKLFDEFELIGLDNFDFFSSNYFLKNRK